MLYKDIDLHSAQMSDLTQKSQLLSSEQVVESTAHLTAKYATLNEETSTLTRDLEGEVTEHEQYREAYKAAMDWVVGTRQQLHLLTDVSGSRQQIQTKLDKLQVSSLFSN